jgi:hypothetical protein
VPIVYPKFSAQPANHLLQTSGNKSSHSKIKVIFKISAEVGNAAKTAKMVTVKIQS